MVIDATFLLAVVLAPNGKWKIQSQKFSGLESSVAPCWDKKKCRVYWSKRGCEAYINRIKGAQKRRKWKINVNAGDRTNCEGVFYTAVLYRVPLLPGHSVITKNTTNTH